MAFQRQARFTVIPQYRQDSEPAGTPLPKSTFNSAPSRSTLQRAETIPLGEELFLNSDQQQQMDLPHSRLSVSPMPSSLQFPSMGEDGYPLQQRSIYWVLTSWEENMNQDLMLQELSKMGEVVVSIIGSQVHQCPSKPNPHRHWLVKMSRQMRKSQFPLMIKDNCYVAPLTPAGKDTIREAMAKYLNYIKGKGPHFIERGVPLMATNYSFKNKRTKSEEIMQHIPAGKKCSEICMMYLQLLPQIFKLAGFRPQRSFCTDLVYYHGPPGTRKTITISRVLNTIRRLYPQVDYYSKMGGLSKFLMVMITKLSRGSMIQ